MADFLLCSNCFQDQGLKLDAAQFGLEDDSTCPHCGTTIGRKLTKDLVLALAHKFFVWGTIHRCDYGAAPVVQFNEQQTTSIETSSWFEPDLRLIEQAAGVGFFYYGPRLWMIGEVEPLKELQTSASRAAIIARILTEYPCTALTTDQLFYRIRKAPEDPADFGEYDSPPAETSIVRRALRLWRKHTISYGRLDSIGFPVMYGS